MTSLILPRDRAEMRNRRLQDPNFDRLKKAAKEEKGEPIVSSGVQVVLPERGARNTTTLMPRHERDPREVLLEQLGDISEMTLMHNLVLVAIYIRPATMKYGTMELELTDKALREDEFQGTVGLVLKKGPAAFRDDAVKTYYGDDVEIGDWVYFRASDGLKMRVKSVQCRRIEDIFICGKIPHPDYVY